MKLKFFQKIIDILRGKNEYLQIHGKNNTIDIPKKSKAKICIYGNNNTIKLEKGSDYTGKIFIGTKDCPGDNCTIEILENTTTFEDTTIRILEDKSKIKIGKECMFSGGIELDCTDTHAIYDETTKELLNKGKFIEIGNHVWIGKNTLICKNTIIPDNCIVGTKSVVTKKFCEQNCIIAGIPATIRKRNVNWSRLRPKIYEQKLNNFNSEK